MKSVFPDIVEKGRISPHGYASSRGDSFGFFLVKYSNGLMLKILASPGDKEGWEQSKLPMPPFDHVSVSVLMNGKQLDRCPTWEEMCYVKDLFWNDDETVVQYHPPKTNHVNIHKYCLHMWKVVGQEFPMPPMACV